MEHNSVSVRHDGNWHGVNDRRVAMSTPEGLVKDKVRRAIAAVQHPVYKFMPVQRGMGDPGLDFYLCSRGRFIAVETKVEGKLLTPRQVITSQDITSAGGIVLACRNKIDADFLRHVLNVPDLFAGQLIDGAP